MSTATIAAAATAHLWKAHPCRCDTSSSCLACEIGAADCTVCGLDSVATETTHCPGEPIFPTKSFAGWRLLAAVINNIGMDYVDGAWRFVDEESVIISFSGERRVVRRAGSIDNLIEYAERRLAYVAGRT